jgi:hypothetical protein
MATQEDVRRIALSLPQVSESADHFGFGVLSRGKLRGFAWAWNERIERRSRGCPTRRCSPCALSAWRRRRNCSRPTRRSSSPSRTTTAFPRCSSRLPAIDAGELAELITDAWRCQAPRALAAELGRPPR